MVLLETPGSPLKRLPSRVNQSWVFPTQLLTSVLLKPAPCVLVSMFMCLVCCLGGALSQKMCICISACKDSICTCVYSWEFVCTHDTSLVPVMCCGVALSSRALLSGCSSFAIQFVCLAVLLRFYRCMALYMLLCYLCLQLVFFMHCTFCVQPSCPTCMHCSEFTVAA